MLKKYLIIALYYLYWAKRNSSSLQCHITKRTRWWKPSEIMSIKVFYPHCRTLNQRKHFFSTAFYIVAVQRLHKHLNTIHLKKTVMCMWGHCDYYHLPGIGILNSSLYSLIPLYLKNHLCPWPTSLWLGTGSSAGGSGCHLKTNIHNRHSYIDSEWQRAL